jgi:AcrR family transcriptional regulator
VTKALKRRGYHHGDLKSALVDAAVELIAEHGVQDFSLARLTRRLGVAPSAPYAHFADRDHLLAAVVVRAYEGFHAEIVPALAEADSPADRLAAIAHAYVRFAGTRRALFEMISLPVVDKHAHPEIADAERPVIETFSDCVAALGGDGTLATAVEAAAHGHAVLLLRGDFDTVDIAAAAAARATMALIAGWDTRQRNRP